MRTRKSGYRKIEEAFVSAHGHRRVPEPTPSFDADVMRRVRKVRAMASADRNGAIAWDPLVWRLAATTCLVALLLVVYAFVWGYGAEHEMTVAFLDNTTDLIVVQSFGVL